MAKLTKKTGTRLAAAASRKNAKKKMMYVVETGKGKMEATRKLTCGGRQNVNMQTRIKSGKKIKPKRARLNKFENRLAAAEGRENEEKGSINRFGLLWRAVARRIAPQLLRTIRLPSGGNNGQARFESQVFACDPTPGIRFPAWDSPNSCSRSAKWEWDRPEGGVPQTHP